MNELTMLERIAFELKMLTGELKKINDAHDRRLSWEYNRDGQDESPISDEELAAYAPF